MSELVSSGLELMAFGMGTVFSFLVYEYGASVNSGLLVKGIVTL